MFVVMYGKTSGCTCQQRAIGVVVSSWIPLAKVTASNPDPSPNPPAVGATKLGWAVTLGAEVVRPATMVTDGLLVL